VEVDSSEIDFHCANAAVEPDQSRLQRFCSLNAFWFLGFFLHSIKKFPR
jgi:hypothetical protein